MSDFDAVVVGSGCAGPVAAFELARAGKSVLVVERGSRPGAKNMTGGRIYAHSLERVFPSFRDEAPLERRIAHERVSLVSEDACFTMDFSSQDMAQQGQTSYAVLRAPFDQWLASKAEDAGAEYVCGIAVDELVKDGFGRVVGVRAGEDEISCDVVLLCDGVNSLLAEQAVGAARPPASGLAVGVKQVVELPASTISDRVLAGSDDEGAAWLFSGCVTRGLFGGGFAYTNRESVSLGIVVGIEAAMRHGSASVCRMLEDFKAHPALAPLIEGGRVVEHSGHMVPEGGMSVMPQLTGEGVLLAGDSAMMCINLGYQVRGMDYAVAAGRIAGVQAARALDAGDTSKAGLAGYEAALEDSFVMKDLRRCSKAPAFLEGFQRMFDGYPQMARDMMNSLFVVDGRAMQPLKRRVAPIVKGVGVLNLLKDARGAMKAL